MVDHVVVHMFLPSKVFRPDGTFTAPEDCTLFEARLCSQDQLIELILQHQLVHVARLPAIAIDEIIAAAQYQSQVCGCRLVDQFGDFRELGTRCVIVLHIVVPLGVSVVVVVLYDLLLAIPTK